MFEPPEGLCVGFWHLKEGKGRRKRNCEKGVLKTDMVNTKRREWLPAPGFLPRESHEQRNLKDCSPLGPKSWTQLIN